MAICPLRVPGTSEHVEQAATQLARDRLRGVRRQGGS